MSTLALYPLALIYVIGFAAILWVSMRNVRESRRQRREIARREAERKREYERRLSEETKRRHEALLYAQEVHARFKKMQSPWEDQ